MPLRKADRSHTEWPDIKIEWFDAEFPRSGTHENNRSYVFSWRKSRGAYVARYARSVWYKQTPRMYANGKVAGSDMIRQVARSGRQPSVFLAKSGDCHVDTRRVDRSERELRNLTRLNRCSICIRLEGGPAWIEMSKALSFKVFPRAKTPDVDSHDTPLPPEILAISYLRHANVQHSYYFFECRNNAFRSCDVINGVLDKSLPAFYLTWHGQRVSGGHGGQPWDKVCSLVNTETPGALFYEHHNITSCTSSLGSHAGVCLAALNVSGLLTLASSTSRRVRYRDSQILKDLHNMSEQVQYCTTRTATDNQATRPAAVPAVRNFSRPFNRA